MLGWPGVMVFPIGGQRWSWKQEIFVRAVVLGSTGGMGKGVCSEVRATLRESIWVSTLGLPFIPYDPMIEKIWVLPTGA